MSDTDDPAGDSRGQTPTPRTAQRSTPSPAPQHAPQHVPQHAPQRAEHQAELPPLGMPEPPVADLAGARGRRRWTYGAAAVTGLAVAIGLWSGAAKADEASHLLALTTEIEAQVSTTSDRSEDLAAVLDTAQRVYDHSEGQVADPATREVLAEALADARAAVAQRVTDAPPSSVTQAHTLLAQATHIETSLDWAAEDLRAAVDMVQQSQGAQRTLETREPVGQRTILTSHDGN